MPVYIKLAMTVFAVSAILAIPAAFIADVAPSALALTVVHVTFAALLVSGSAMLISVLVLMWRAP